MGSTTIPKGSNIERIRANLRANIQKEKKAKQREKNTYHNSKWSKYYGTKAWHTLRDWYIGEHPFCEMHQKYGILKEAECVHHKKIFGYGETEDEKYRLLLEPSNVMSLCESCHKEMHRIAKEKNLSYIDRCIPVELQEEEEIQNEI